jgi:hypothetical protein
LPDQGERLTHLLVIAHASDRAFTRRGGGDPKVRDVERRAHGERLAAQVAAAFSDQDHERENYDLAELAALGTIVTVEGSPSDEDFPLRVDSLEQFTTHKAPLPKWLLLSVLPATSDQPERAVVWVSDQYRDAFIKLFADYLDTEKDSPKGHPRNRELVANMARIRAMVLRDLWQSDGEPDETQKQWWELWLRRQDDGGALLAAYCEANELRVADRHLTLDARMIFWVEARWNDLLPLPFTAVPLAEIRRPQFVDTIEDLSLEDQNELLDDLSGRVISSADGAPAVCVVDTGVRRTHVLLEHSLSESDMHSVVGEPAGDVVGHGTLTAGLALYGPLDRPLLGSDSVTLRHRLESVKLLHDSKTQFHDPEVYGVVTAEAFAAPEAANPRRRVFCFPITARGDGPGTPSLWSAALDALAVGTDIGRSDDGLALLGPPSSKATRLVVVAAGNVSGTYEIDYRQKSDLSPICDPAQAWNVLTVGAATDLTAVPDHADFAGWRPLAAAGDISPHSRTGVIAGGKSWPAKPDVCMEGGNVLTDGVDFHDRHPLLSVLTTGHHDDDELVSMNATSAATAQVSRLAAMTMAMYPAYWPETVRALLVHHAEWTPTMREVIQNEAGKVKRLALLKRYGWGVPDEQAVLTSSRSAVTMVVQDEFVPFSGPDFKLRHFRLHELPWPTGVLHELGAEDVDLRVTLSYFVEPSAANRGWRRRYAYASHGLRFELSQPNETQAKFISRVNREAANEEGGGSTPSPNDDWVIGPNQRNTGSLHQDIWEGSGSDLAATGGLIAVHAVGGWWKNNKRKDRVELPVRYALVVSLKTKTADVDLYTPISTELQVPINEVVVEI